MDSDRTIDLPPSVSTNAGELEKHVHSKANRLTKLNFADGPEIDDNRNINGNVLATKESVTPDPLFLSASKKRKAAAWQDNGHGQRPNRETSLKNSTKPGVRDLKIVEAAKSGVSVLDNDLVRLESPWVRYHKRYEMNVDGPTSVVTDRLYPHNLFMVKCLEGHEADRKIRMLQEVRHQHFHNMLEFFSFEDSYYAVFHYVDTTLSKIVYSPPHPTEIELAAAMAQVRLSH
jgi:hypothetical protein